MRIIKILLFIFHTKRTDYITIKMITLLTRIKNIIFKDYSTDIALRYWPVIDIIKKNRLSDLKILEVGSEDSGITTYFKKEVIGLDVEFNEKKNKWLKKIKYQGGKFPFAGSQFGLVISVDSLEHVARPQRQSHISEMLRVAKRGIIIIVPCGQLAEKHDRKMQDLYFKINKSYDKYLSEHIVNRLPGRDEIIEYIREGAKNSNKKVKTITQQKLLNIRVREFILKCKFSHNILLSVIYYLCLVLLPFRRFINFGNCYRYLIYAEIT